MNKVMIESSVERRNDHSINTTILRLSNFLKLLKYQNKPFFSSSWIEMTYVFNYALFKYQFKIFIFIEEYLYCSF